MTCLTNDKRLQEIQRRLQQALPELLEAIEDKRPITNVLLANGLGSGIKRDLYALGYLENLSKRTGRGARYRWKGPKTAQDLQERLPVELGELQLQRRSPKGRGRFVVATVARTCSRCEHLIERGDIYLVTVSRHGERPVCLICQRPLDLPEHEEALERLRLQLQHVRYLQPQEFATWRHRLRQAGALLEKRVNVNRHGAPRDLYQNIETLADWLLGAERIADRHLRALRYRANPSEFTPRDLMSYKKSEVEKERPTNPLPTADRRVEIISAEEFERGLPYTPAVVEQACKQAVTWLRELGEQLNERHQKLQPTKTTTS